MVFRVEVTKTAEGEADEAYEWIAKYAPQAALRWYRGLLEAIHSLADNPERCSLAPEDEDFPEEIRNFLYGKRANKYRVIFTIRGATVYVLHILHAARKPLRPGQ